MINILDHEWVGNLLNLTFTLVVFLLGLPIVFYQTFIPEGLREFETEQNILNKKLLKISSSLLVFFILIIGNNGIVRYLEYAAENFSSDNYTSYLQEFLIIYYFFCLFAFVLFSIITYKVFNLIIFRKSDIYFEVLDFFFNRINFHPIDISTSNKLTSQITRLSRIYLIHEYREQFLIKLFDFLTTILKGDFDLKSQSHRITDIFFSNIITDVISLFTKETNLSFSEIMIIERNFSIIIPILKNKSFTFSLEKLKYDHKESILQLINSISNSYNLKNLEFIKKLTSNLSLLNVDEMEFFNIYYRLFEIKQYKEVEAAIGRSFNQLEMAQKPMKAVILGLITLFAGSNIRTLNEVGWDALNNLKANNLIVNDDIYFAISYFKKYGKFETADGIRNHFIENNEISD